MKSPSSSATIVRVVAVAIHYALYASAALLLLGLYLVGSADVIGPLDPDTWSWVQGAGLATILISLPTAIFLVSRKSTALSVLAALPVLCTFCFMGYAQVRKTLTASEMVDHVVTSVAGVAGHTVPAGSHVRLIDRGRHAITLAAGATYDSLPIVGEFEVDERGEPFGAAYIARDADVAGIACSDRAPVLLGKGGAIGCTLSANSSIDGVPCASGLQANFKGLPGRRADCTTSKSIALSGVVWPAGTHVDLNPSQLDDDSNVTDLAAFTIGHVPPKIRLFGKPLATGTTVTFEFDGSIEIEREHRGYCQPAGPEPGCVQHSNYARLRRSDFTIDGRSFAASNQP